MPDTLPLPDLLDELLRAYGPCGEEGAVRDVVRRELEPHADEVTVDAAGDLVALLHGTDRSASPVRVAAHLDELSMTVERVEPDGTLRVTSLGVMYPGNASQAEASGRTAARRLPGPAAPGRLTLSRPPAGSGRARGRW